MPLGALYAVYVSQSTLLKEYGANIGLANCELVQRLWMAPFDADPASVISVAESYDRVNIGEAYAEILTSGNGSSGDAMSAKIQSDYVASQERAFHLRMNSKIRCGIHASVRRAGHGNIADGVFARVDGYIQDVIVAGAAGFAPP